MKHALSIMFFAAMGGFVGGYLASGYRLTTALSGALGGGLGGLCAALWQRQKKD